MLVSIAVENFKSFDKLTEFSMLASKSLRNDKEKINKINDVAILKSAVLYGANASGKTNLIDAFKFVKQCLSSGKIPLEAKSVFCKNNQENENKITTCEIRMCIAGKFYAYGIDVLLKERSICGEWILELTSSNTPTMLFQRDGNNIAFGNSLKLTDEEDARIKIYADDFADNVSTFFLYEMNRNKKIHKDSNFRFFKDIFEWLARDVKIFYPNDMITGFEYYSEDVPLELVKKIIKTFDTGITNLELKSLTNEEFSDLVPSSVFKNVMEKVAEVEKFQEETDDISKKQRKIEISMRTSKMFFNIELDPKSEELQITTLSFKHGKSFYDFAFDEESDGTRRIFELLDILLTTNENSVYIIDEMERSLHPALTKRFIELLNEYHQESNVQLIFSTHESTIMTQELFRRDQIWFVAKDNTNHSNLYPLDAFKERYDKKINKAYLEGRYGAIPIFKEFNLGGLD